MITKTIHTFTTFVGIWSFRQRLKLIRQCPKSLGQRPTGQFANVNSIRRTSYNGSYHNGQVTENS